MRSKEDQILISSKKKPVLLELYIYTKIYDVIIFTYIETKYKYIYRLSLRLSVHRIIYQKDLRTTSLTYIANVLRIFAFYRCRRHYNRKR